MSTSSDNPVICQDNTPHDWQWFLTTTGSKILCKKCGRQRSESDVEEEYKEKYDTKETVKVEVSHFKVDDEVFDPNVEKPVLDGLFIDNPETPEGKYLVIGRDGKAKKWPHFVLAATDPMAEDALRAYADAAEEMLTEEPERAAKMGVTLGFIAAVRRRADFFHKYHDEHGDGDPGRGRHRKDDPATVALMREVMASS